ncbi:putative carboxylesterase [Rosa chinensis]|uniref:Putative carboxylesterase n=1 Tax=Rosa chinensis TaxID=74649 RepID=A0A2P6RS73_ROSCH|nr:putative carboxylesterase [Rosa chinensis]
MALDQDAAEGNPSSSPQDNVFGDYDDDDDDDDVDDSASPFSTFDGVTSRPEEAIAAANPLFADDVATKDIHIDLFTSLSIRIFLSEFALNHRSPPINLGFDSPI